MNCYFCQQPCQENKNLSSEPSVTGDTWQGWLCDRHVRPVSYIKVSDGSFYAFYYEGMYKGVSFTAEYYKLPDGDSFELRSKVGGQIILQFQWLPPFLTPDNIDQRLPTLLTFS